MIIFLLKLLIAISFLGNWMVWLGYLPQSVTWLEDIIPLCLFLYVCITNRWNIEWRHIWLVLTLLAITFASYVLNGTDPIKGVLFFRMLFRFYPLYLTLINSNIKEKLLKQVIMWIFVFVALQLPVAIGKALIYGQGENAIGTYAFHGGGLSLLIPLVVISFAFSAYILDERKYRYLLICLAAAFYAFIGGKRAIVVYIPIVISLCILLLWSYNRRRPVIILCAVTLIILLGWLGLKTIPTLNPEGKIGGAANPSFAIDYIKSYNTKITEDNMSEGRFLVPERTFKWLKEKGYGHLLLGVGPGKFMQTFIDSQSQNLICERLSILYGMSDFFFIALQIGFPGAILYLSLYIMIMKEIITKARVESEIYWKIIAFGTGCFAIILAILEVTYGQFAADDLVPSIFFMLAGIVGSYHKNLQKSVHHNFEINTIIKD